MSFEDLKTKIIHFFEACKAPKNVMAKVKIKNQVLAHFHREMRPSFEWKKMLKSRFAGGAFATAFGFLVLGVWQTPLFNHQSLAGQIQTEKGLVEIIRSGKSVLVREQEDIYVGDWIHLGNKAEAQLTLDGRAVSTLSDKIKIQVLGNDRLFVQKGVLSGQIKKSIDILTDRGMVKTAGGSSLTVEVSDTGETRIRPQEESLYVFDHQEGQIQLNQGEEIVLRSDTRLSEVELPKDLNLSRLQLQEIADKLSIARSKALTAVENQSLGHFDVAAQNLESAQKSFVSMVQVLNSSRELEITKRTDLSQLHLEDVLPLLQAKTQNKGLLRDVESTQTLLTFLEEAKSSIAFGVQETGVESFDRYVLLGYLESIASEDQRVQLHHIADQYVAHFIRKIHSAELKIDQIALLHQEVNKLPQSQEAQNFLTQVLKGFSPYLAQILAPKIQATF